MSQQAIPLEELKAGMVVAKQVLSNSGRVLLERGAVLTAEKIQYLKSWKVREVSIREVKENSKIGTKPSLSQLYCEALDLSSQLLEQIRISQAVDIAKYKQLVDTHISQMVDMVGIIESLYQIKCHSEYTYRHSLNVSILCGLMGRWLGYKDDELRNLMLAGLLHDVGKTCISKAILDKPGKLNEEETEIMHSHSQRGYRLLAKLPDVPKVVKEAVLQHHERNDGSGYPLGLTKADISIAGKIVAVADIYDAMTNERVYKEKLPPFTVIDNLIEQMYEKLEPELCLTFVENIRERLKGASVLLNNGKTGKVLFFTEAFSSRPVVQLTNGACVNLERQRNLAVVEVLQESLSSR